MAAASCSLCLKRSVSISNNIIFVPRKLASSLKKATFCSNACRLHKFGAFRQSTCPQSSKLGVLLSDKYTQHCLRHCYVPLAVAVGLLLGWTALKLNKHTVSCVAEAAEDTEYHHDNKEQTNQHCQVVSLEEAIYESDHLLQRVKVTENGDFISVYYITSSKQGGYEMIMVMQYLTIC